MHNKIPRNYWQQKAIATEIVYKDETININFLPKTLFGHFISNFSLFHSSNFLFLFLHIIKGEKTFFLRFHNYSWIVRVWFRFRMIRFVNMQCWQTWWFWIWGRPWRFIEIDSLEIYYLQFLFFAFTVLLFPLHKLKQSLF